MWARLSGVVHGTYMRRCQGAVCLCVADQALCPGDVIANQNSWLGLLRFGLLHGYFIISSLVMVNTLVAIMNNTVNRIQEESKVVPDVDCVERPCILIQVDADISLSLCTFLRAAAVASRARADRVLAGERV